MSSGKRLPGHEDEAVVLKNKNENLFLGEFGFNVLLDTNTIMAAGKAQYTLLIH